jgi:hypothetical protein
MARKFISTTIYVTPTQDAGLKTISDRLGCPVSTLQRLAFDALLNVERLLGEPATSLETIRNVLGLNAVRGGGRRADAPSRRERQRGRAMIARPPKLVWVSWCSRCGIAILAGLRRDRTSCPTCPVSALDGWKGPRVRFSRYVLVEKKSPARASRRKERQHG